MSTLRTYYWHDRVKGRAAVWYRRHVRGINKAWHEFGIGNAGDIFARNLIDHFYPGVSAANVDTGPRLLCVGSIAHKSAPGDVLCGIGTKGSEIQTQDRASILVHALRGPITRDALQREGFDTSTVQWLGDPGLMISKMLPPRSAKPGRVIFIPHYRELREIRGLVPKGINVVAIDDDPLRVGRKIQEAELVYSSSLHGIVFAHALGRPVKMVKPAANEPLIKFDDYYLGVGLPAPQALETIAEADFKTAPTSPDSLSVRAEDIVFPTSELLTSRGILT